MKGVRTKEMGKEERSAAQRRARALGESTIHKSVAFLRAVQDGLVRDCTVADRIRATENLLDRFGFPRLQNTTVSGEFPVKLIDMAEWMPEQAAKRDGQNGATTNGTTNGTSH